MTAGPLPDWAKDALLAAGMAEGDFDAPPITAQELADYLAEDCPRCDGAGATFDLPLNGEPLATSPDRDCPMCKGSGRVAW